MLEELCRMAMYHTCRTAEQKAPLVTLKGKPWKKENEFKDFFTATSSFTFYPGLPLKRAMNERVGSLLRKSWAWINENADNICNAYIKNRHNNNLTEAMRQAKTFDVLFADFKKYFAQRRGEFMENTENRLAEQRTSLAKSKKTPQSHGGVANLLKVLTKTMHDQGSSVYTIAKVQYAVCLQAGIYIPEEFLTDVLVASEIMNEAEVRR
jgi:hypothetical protein